VAHPQKVGVGTDKAARRCAQEVVEGGRRAQKVEEGGRHTQKVEE
jgi:hypothetical protein